jgi:hypothetical protein
MTTEMPTSIAENSPEAIKARIKPVLDRFAVKALKAWLKTLELTSTADTRATITDLVVKHVFDGKLAEEALSNALIGFEEASDMRIYLFRMNDGSDLPPDDWLLDRLKAMGIPLTSARVFAGDKSKPMSPVYAHSEGGFLRVKWAEEQRHSYLDEVTDSVKSTPVYKRIVLVADFHSKIAELRLNPPENRHTYYSGDRPTADAYYEAYTKKAQELLCCEFERIELRSVVKNLVEQEDPRVVRIHIDNHTNQKNAQTRTKTPHDDVRDDPDWKLMYEMNGETWAWDAPSFYWLPKASSGFLARELFTHINPEEGFVKVNADCSDDEVGYVVSQIRARETKKSEAFAIA